MLNMAMRKSPVATKTSRASTGSKKRTRVKEEEQLYLVRKSAKLTDGKRYKHPIQEAAKAEQRLNEKAR